MDSAGLRELLTFYADAGVDEPLLDEAPDRFQETRAEAEKRAAQRQQPTPQKPVATTQPRSTAAAAVRAAVPDDAQAARAREMGSAADMPRMMRITILANACGAAVGGLAMPYIFEVAGYDILFILGGVAMLAGAIVTLPRRVPA